MFRASSCPSSGATTTAVAASGLPSELGGSSAVGRGRAGQQHCYKYKKKANYTAALQQLNVSGQQAILQHLTTKDVFVKQADIKFCLIPQK